MMTRVLIVGGAGFIGSHLVRVCLERACQVWVYDDFSTGRRANLPADSALHVVEGDILDAARLSSAIDECRPDRLFHLAAIHYIPACEQTPERALRVNVEGTQNVLSACARRGVPRLVCASTGALYDPITTSSLAETSPVKGQDIYSISKLAGEQLVQYHVSKHGGEAVMARLFNTVGRRETNPHVIPAIMAQLVAGNRRIELGNLHPRRDYVHVEDVAEALAALGAMPMEQPFGIFNVGSGMEHSVEELVRLCAKAIGEPIEVVVSAERRRKFDRPSQLADLANIRKATGWAPKRTLEQALREIWKETLDARPVAGSAATT